MNKLTNIFGFIICILISCIPRNKRKIVFGSWLGDGIKDNPKYLYEYFRDNLDGYIYVWIVKHPDQFVLNHKDTKVLKYGSMRARYHIITSGISVFNHGFVDFDKINLIKGSFQFQLWHGVPWKKIGYDRFENYNINGIKEKIVRWYNEYNLYIASSENYFKQIQSAFSISGEKILKVGQPRNAILFDDEKCKMLRKSYFEKYNINENTIIITYMPTFRECKNNYEFLSDNDINKLCEISGKNLLFILKEHFVNKSKVCNTNNILNINEIDSQELLAITDILITDYSSCFFDFLIRDKPIIHYIYDYEYYKNEDRGLYYTVDEVQCGLIAYNKEELVNCLLHIFEVDDTNVLRKSAINKYINYETKDSSSILLNCLVEKNILRMEDSN